ncbi:Regulatory protein AfsR [Gemmata sp. SH-PL17]|uniref:ATP-binding protein n=1 Tax=Gemmata sp. SH-PL17 TaxID=1630693 RepID=UPI00078DB345|nr:NB-ARC domain-containing protein [Gemmata sp. SH-PL17]AMV24079.1 Regulatory protein AfsR [Gemmata sp. SH-PL17]
MSEERQNQLHIAHTPILGLGDRRFSLGRAAPDFTGRGVEIRQMVDRFQAGTVGTFLLWGMGGVGKTTLAQSVAHAVADQFPDALIELNLQAMSDVPISSSEAMASIIHAFHPDEKLPDKKPELRARYRTVLYGKRALILFDNVKNEEQVQDLLAAAPTVGFILTSRNALALSSVLSISLDVLPSSDSIKFLARITSSEVNNRNLSAIAKLCGHLPLALRVAGSNLTIRKSQSTSQYIEALEVENTRLERLKGKTITDDVKAVLSLSARELVHENARLAQRWQMLSVFPADFDKFAVAAVWDLISDSSRASGTVEEELTALIDRSLVQYDTNTDRYSLHDLMRPISREVFEYVEGHPLQADSARCIAAAKRRFAIFYCNKASEISLHHNKNDSHIRQDLDNIASEITNINHGQAWANRSRHLGICTTNLFGGRLYEKNIMTIRTTLINGL